MHVTNFKWQQPTAMEARQARKAEKLAEQRKVYLEVDQRDGGCDRTDGSYLWPGHADPKLRREHHHLIARSLKAGHNRADILTISAWLHMEIHAGKARLSGDADLRDVEGKLCGVKYERLTESGWEVVGYV